MLFARDKSQMCNNLLQFAHVYAWGREHGRRTISMRFSYKYPYFHIQHTRCCSFFWYIVAKALAAIHLLPTVSFKYADCDHDALERKMLKHQHIQVFGWWVRFYDLFLKYRDEIVDLFAFEPFIIQHVEEYLQKEEAIVVAHESAQQNDKGKAAHDSLLRLGVHIRRGDYRNFQGGRYFYEDNVFIDYIKAFIKDHTDKDIIIYICGNDPQLAIQDYQQQLPAVKVCWHQGNPAEDLCLLSQCDYLMGPPSTFSLTASMYRDVPLCWMETPDATQMQFDCFANLFRQIR